MFFFFTSKPVYWAGLAHFRTAAARHPFKFMLHRKCADSRLSINVDIWTKRGMYVCVCKRSRTNDNNDNIHTHTHTYIYIYIYYPEIIPYAFLGKHFPRDDLYSPIVYVCVYNFLFFNNGRILPFTSRPIPRTPFLSYTYIRGLTLTPLSDLSELVYSQYRIVDTTHTSWGIFNYM
jgi:hypothetical protein